MATPDDINSTLQNIARQLGNWVSSQSNAVPMAIASTSPVSYPFNNIGTTTATTVVAANTKRHGLIFHNPGATASIYVYPSAMTSAPTTSALGGTFVIYPGSTLSFPSPLFANVNGAWSAFSGTGSGQPFTVVEFL
jgi:hypothetical protein